MLTNIIIFTAFLFLVYPVGVLAAIHTMLTVCTFQGAIARAISLVTPSEFTLIPHLILGRSTFAGYVDAWRFHNARLREITLSDDWRWLCDHESGMVTPQHTCMQALPRLIGTPYLARNRVRLLINDAEAFKVIFVAIMQARQVLIMQFFIVHDDTLGRRLAELPLDHTRVGVCVRFPFDNIGCRVLPRRHMQRLIEGGVRAKLSSTRARLVNRFQLNFRNHRKPVVVDGKCTYVGDRNVGNEYMGEKLPLAP